MFVNDRFQHQPLPQNSYSLQREALKLTNFNFFLLSVIQKIYLLLQSEILCKSEILCFFLHKSNFCEVRGMILSLWIPSLRNAFERWFLSDCCKEVFYVFWQSRTRKARKYPHFFLENLCTFSLTQQYQESIVVLLK